MVPFICNSPKAGWYVGEWRRGKALTAAGGTVRTSWAGSDLDAAGFDRFMMDALNARINLRGGLMSLGGPLNARKGTTEYQCDLRRDVRSLRDILHTRLRVYQFSTPEMTKRYGHLLARYDD